MPVAERLDAAQQRHRWIGFVVAVVYKFLDDQGGYLAALIAYYAFLSMFPLLLLSSTVLGWVLVDNPDLQRRILDTALSQFPVIGEQLGQPEQLSGGTVGVVIGVAGALYGGLGVSVALQNAMNTVWSVPRNDRPDPFVSRARGLLLLSTVGAALLATTVLAAFGSGVGALGGGTRVAVLAASMAVNAGAFVVAFRIATARPLTVAQVAPGAIAAAIGWQLLQTFGATYVGSVIKGASATNAVFALVLGMLAFFYITATIIVVCAIINAVRVDRLHPRALLTPFTDNVDLTAGDRRVYSAQAQAQRSKGFENVHVTFDPPPHRAEEPPE